MKGGALGNIHKVDLNHVIFLHGIKSKWGVTLFLKVKLFDNDVTRPLGLHNEVYTAHQLASF